MRHLRAGLPAQRHRLRRRQAEAGRQGDAPRSTTAASARASAATSARRSARASASASSTCATQVLPMEPGVYEGIFGRYRRDRRGALHGSGDPRALPGRRRGDGDPRARAPRGALRRRVRVRGRREHAGGAEAASVVTTVEDAIASASSWYTYCPNNLALADAERMGLKKVGFVGVPCQITPVRKIQLADPALPRQRPQEGEAHRAADEVPEGLRRERRLHHRPPLHRGVHLRGPHGAEDPEARWASRSPT